MGIFRRENDGRRVVRFPDKDTAEKTISLITSVRGPDNPNDFGRGTPALTGGKKPSRKERRATREEIKTIQKDARQMASDNPVKYGSESHSIWSDKPNQTATREAAIWPSKDSHTGKAGMSEYDPSKKKPETSS